MTWPHVATTVAVVQGLATITALYLTVLSLRHTAQGVQTALYEHAAHVSPHVSVYGKVETGFALRDPRIEIFSTNDGTGPAIDVRLNFAVGVDAPSIDSTDICVTASGGAAILRAGNSVRWTAIGSSNLTDRPLLVTCEDAEGGEWKFAYRIKFPEHSGPLAIFLEKIVRPKGMSNEVTMFGEKVDGSSAN